MNGGRYSALQQAKDALIGSVGGTLIRKAGQWKVRGLVEWLHRVHDIDVREPVLPLLSDRTEPYDVNVMLDAN